MASAENANLLLNIHASCYISSPPIATRHSFRFTDIFVPGGEKKKNPPELPKNLPAPPNTIILVTSADLASSLTAPALAHLTHDSSATLLSAAVDSLPGSKGGNSARVVGYSWLITDHTLPIRMPPTKSPKSLTFCLPTANFTLPLANTVFQTGTPTTLVHIAQTVKPKTIEAAVGLSDPEVEEFAHAQETIKEAWHELGHLMKMVGVKKGLLTPTPVPEDSIEIQVPDEVLKDTPVPGSGRVYSQLPLQPLTPPRKIAEGLGNILKSVEQPGACQGASLELESAVAKYLDTLAPEDVPSRVGVYARLTTQEPAAAGVSELLLYPGARLHRVMSGGGGWGSKMGLLSLDPQYDQDVARFESEFSARFDGKEGGESEGIVKKGHWIQFFAARNAVPLAEKGIQFGAVGKVEDVCPVEDDAEERTVDGWFGGASELGVDVGVAGTNRRMDVPGGVVVVEA